MAERGCRLAWSLGFGALIAAGGCREPEALAPSTPLVIAAAGEGLFAPPPVTAFETWPPSQAFGGDAGSTSVEAQSPTSGASPEEVAAMAAASDVSAAREALGRLDFAAATTILAGVLETQPDNIPARHVLARVHALAGRPDEAMAALAVLGARARQTPHARQLLDDARVDPDFKALRRMPAFRDLTGATAVQVSWVAGDVAGEARARQLAEALERDRWEARLEVVPADRQTGFAEGLLVNPTDAVARRVAHRVAVLSGGLKVAEGAEASADVPIVARFAGRGPGEAPSTEEAEVVKAVPAPQRVTDLTPWHGVELKATADGAMHALKLRPTGFFEWRVVGPAGRQEVRRGKFELTADELRLSYRLTVDAPAQGENGPTTETREGEQQRLVLGQDGDALLVGGLRFAR
jgi:hypothetical protein